LEKIRKETSKMLEERLAQRGFVECGAATDPTRFVDLTDWPTCFDTLNDALNCYNRLGQERNIQFRLEQQSDLNDHGMYTRGSLVCVDYYRC
jgi:hypothetical protein